MSELIHGDCLDVVQTIPDKSIDMILCDLPYGTTACKWDTIIPFEPLWDQYYRILRPNGFIILTASQPFTTKLIYSNIDNFSHQWIWQKEQGSNPLLANIMPMKDFEDVVAFSNQYQKHDIGGFHPLRPYAKKVFNFIGKTKKEIFKEMNSQGACHFMRFDSSQFNLCTEKTYDNLIKLYSIHKMNGFIRYSYLNETDKGYRKNLIEEFNKKFPRVYNPQMTGGKEYKGGGGYIKHLDKRVRGGNTSDKRYPTSIIKFNTDKSNSLHPTQKPVELFKYLIKTYTNEGDTVLDNCSGSGTTAIACLETNRNYICIEKDKTYYDLSVERINKHQETLFSKAI